VPGYTDPQAFNRYSYCLNNPINRIDPSGHWSWGSFWKAAAGALVGVVAGVLAGPAGFALVHSLWAAGAIGGAVGGAVSGGLNGGWKGALIGGAMGGALGGIGGWGVGEFGSKFGAGMLTAGAGVAGATDSWDSFAGGLVGGLAGNMAGNSFIGTEHFQNWKAGNGWQNNSDYTNQQKNISRMYEQLFGGEAVAEFTLASNDGHMGMGLTGYYDDGLFGKYPNKSFTGTSLGNSRFGKAVDQATWIFGRRAPGAVYSESNKISFNLFPPVRRSWMLNKLQYHMVQDYVGKGGSTFMLTTNCGDWVFGAARTAGIHVPNNMSTIGFTNPKHSRAWLDSMPDKLLNSR